MNKTRKSVIARNTYNLAKGTYRGFDRAGSSAFRWMTTEHTGFRKHLDLMPKGMSFWAEMRWILLTFVIHVFAGLLAAVLFGLLIAFGVPFLITALFTF